jgi:hypothetical protein
LLLHFDNNAIDNSLYNAPMTFIGSPVYSSSVYKFGAYSANVSPSGKRFDTPTSASRYRLGTGDFTIEFWFNGSTTGTQRLMGNMAPGYSWSLNTTWVIGCYSGGAIGFENPTNGVIAGAARPFNGAWHHFAVVRSGTTITTYVDGVQDAQNTGGGFNIDQNATSTQLSAGGSGNGTGASETFNGYLDDVRVTIGYARYTSTPFTVPSAAFPNNGPLFSTFTFTNMAATGNVGPVATTYNPTPLGWGGLSNGTQLWTVPLTGTYRITAAGAGGGFAQLSATTNPYPSSNGIIVSNTYAFTQGQIIKILVGQRGTDEQLNGGGTQYASGGGGSFVVYSSNNTPILVAGGGGGWWGSLASTSPGAGNGVATTSGTSGQAGGNAGTSGNAGSSGDNPSDAGAGFSSNLFNGSGTRVYAYSFLNGGLGQPGTIVISGGTQIPGGFGCAGFGGGGYSGGGGLSFGGQRFGGGGGSYDINTLGNATIYTGLSGYSSGYNVPSAHGFVVIDSPFTFTTMGTRGATGPPSTATYATPPQGGFTITSGIQYWTVPTTAYYTFIAAGAGSQNWTGYTGGRGIVVSTRVSLNSGTIIKILVGQQGNNTISYTSGNYAGYGAGGGTFIYNNSTSSIILIAGGGGNPFNIVSGPGGDAVAATTASNGTAGGQGGSGGNGCVNTSPDHNGGAGFNSGSAGNAHGDSLTTVAQSFMNGGTGATYNGQPVGGFGGGGQIGGGGGYSGGGCIGFGQSGWGGGGGSYDVNGISNNALIYTTLVNGVSGGYNTGSGFVVVTLG